MFVINDDNPMRASGATPPRMSAIFGRQAADQAQLFYELLP
jgi:hypothetical protein